jgi:hypothetical protein
VVLKLQKKKKKKNLNLNYINKFSCFFFSFPPFFIGKQTGDKRDELNLPRFLTTQDGLVKERWGKGLGFRGAGVPLDFAASNRTAVDKLRVPTAILSMPTPKHSSYGLCVLVKIQLMKRRSCLAMFLDGPS